MDFLLNVLSDLVASIILALVPYLLFRVFGWRFFVHPGAALKGWFAEDDEFKKSDNPYPTGTLKHDAWNDGYDASTETKKPGTGK